MSRRSSGDDTDLSRISLWFPADVRYSDMDEQGHVNNAVFLTYFEQGRIGYFNAVRRRGRELLAAAETTGLTDARAIDVPPAADDSRLELPLVIADAHVYYRRPIASLAPVVVGARAASLGRASLEIIYAVCAEPRSQPYAIGSTTVACVDLATGRPRALPTWAVAAIRDLDALAT
jgi:acyl-CoA thioester hydrolase